MASLGASGGYWIQQVLNGLFLASIYCLLATAYALLQGLTNRIILSFGDIATFGAFAAVSAAVYAMLHGWSGALVLMAAVAVAGISAAGVGRLLHSMAFRPLGVSGGQAVMIASVSLSIVIQELLRLHSAGRDQWLPPLFDGSLRISEGRFPVQIGFTQLGSLALAWLLLASLHAAMATTPVGREWRSVAQNRRLAELCGVDTERVVRWSFIAAGGLAGISGAVIATAYGGVSFVMGLVLGFKAMFAAIIGGFGTLGGAIAGGLFLAMVEVMWTALFPAAYRDIAVFAIIILVLLVRPEGLLGRVLRREDHI